MARGSLAVVKAWLQAVNDREGVDLEELSADRVLITGPRGSGEMHPSVLSEWLVRAGFSATPMRWFCGHDGRVVVEHDGAGTTR